MHFFALFLLLALSVMGLTMLIERVHARYAEIRAFVAGMIGVGLAWLANVNMWTGFGVGHARYTWVAITVTGIAFGGAALLFHEVVRLLAGLHRKVDDQAEQLEREELGRVSPMSRAS